MHHTCHSPSMHHLLCTAQTKHFLIFRMRRTEYLKVREARGIAQRTKWPLRSVKACPGDDSGWFSVFALPHIGAPPNLQNHLILTSESDLNYQGVDWSSLNSPVGGKGRQKDIPGKPVSNRDSTSSRCTDNQTQYQMHGAVRQPHGQIEQWSA